MVWLRKVWYRVPLMAQSSSSPTPALDENAIAEALLRMRILNPGERPRCQPLEGGVSSDIWLIDLPGRRLCLKRALPRLKVEPLWEAPVRRNRHEWNWLRVAGRICPDAVPQLIAQDGVEPLFAMGYLDPALFPSWKTQLRDGNADPATAAEVATRLALIYGATSGHHQLARMFGRDEDYYAIRLEPYLMTAARAHPDLAEPLEQLAQDTASNHH